MVAARILVIDDEVFNLELIREFLEDAGFVLETFISADAAWEHLAAARPDYDVILLDRMMPGMDGISFLHRLKQDAQFCHIPVIMQTAAASEEEVREGIAAGAYYYLAKPYDARTLLAIVRAALEVRRPLPATVQAAEAGNYHEFRTLDEARALAAQLAQMCPQAETVSLGLLELFLNAIEHGNLELNYEDKRRLRLADGWEDEVQRRLAAPEFAGRSVAVSTRREGDEIVFTIRDAGRGFDWHRYLEFEPARVYDPNGRGIAMARQLSFARLEYAGSGNVAVATVRLAE